MAPRDGSDAGSTDHIEAVKGIRGPDLNASRGELDKKLYRQILLPNGIRCVLIQDTVAMHMDPVGDYYDIDDEIDEESDSNDEASESQDEEGKNTNGEEDGSVESGSSNVRDAAAAVLVGAGSMYDPPSCQGLVRADLSNK